MRQRLPAGFGSFNQIKGFLRELLKRGGAAITTLCMLMIAALIAGCGGGSGGSGAGVSSQTVSGVAATGAPLVGQVTLRDSSSVHKDKVTVIANDGSFSVDVSDMQAPYLLKATGTVDGVSRTLFSFADQPGTANINPLSSVALANAAGVDNPATIFDKPDPSTLDKVQSAMPGSIVALQTKLRPLLSTFGASSVNPVTGPYTADHDGLDGVFDNVKVTLSNGTLTITNATTDAVIFTAQVKDVEGGTFTDNDNDLPQPGPRPAAPTATGGDGQVAVTWDPVVNATSYNLFYATKSNVATEEDNEDVDAKQVKNVTSPFVLKGLAANTTYYFMVRALNNNRRGPPSTVASATTSATIPTPTIPAAPTGVTATGGTKQVTVSWPAVADAASYNLYWSTTAGVTTANGTKISGVTSPAVQAGLTDNTTYYYIVTAQNSAGESAASVQVAATTLAVNSPPPTIPSAPTGVTATGGDTQVTLSWTAVTGASSYNIYWSTTSGVTTSTGTRIAGVSSAYVQTGLGAGTTYFYIVTAVNGAGESGPSVQASATTNAPTTVPAVPTAVTASGGVKQVTLSWAAVSSATSYNVYWSATSGVTTATGTKVSGVTSPYVQTGLTDGTAYFFIVTAANAVGEGAASAQVTATTNTASIDGAALYTQYCSGCHGALASSTKRGASAALITSGIASVSSMNTLFDASNGTLIKLTPDQITAISAALQ
jgi:hypothetical protein